VGDADLESLKGHLLKLCSRLSALPLLLAAPGVRRKIIDTRSNEERIAEPERLAKSRG
jgi:hypothetical protein